MHEPQREKVALYKHDLYGPGVGMRKLFTRTLQSKSRPPYTYAATGIGDGGGGAAGLESSHARVGSRGAGGGGQGSAGPPSQNAGQTVGQSTSLTHSSGAGGTDRFSSRGGDRPSNGQAGVFLLRVDVEGEVRYAGWQAGRLNKMMENLGNIKYVVAFGS